MLEKNQKLFAMFERGLEEIRSSLRKEIEEEGDEISDEDLLNEALSYISPPKVRKIDPQSHAVFLEKLGGEERVAKEFLELIADFDLGGAKNRVVDFVAYCEGNPAIAESYLREILGITLEFRNEGLDDEVLVVGSCLAFDGDFLIVRKESPENRLTVGVLNHETLEKEFYWESLYDVIASGFDLDE